jgi:hydrophobic/amphiphilic exporter-1 (mainly G- bacteria), HAE1 family
VVTVKETDENKNIHIPELEEKMNFLGKWAAFFIARYRIVYLIMAAILIWGGSAYFQMPRELSPQIILPFGHVFTVYPGAAPEEVESLITDEIEKKMDELNHVKVISSTSGFGYSSVFIEFETGVDIDDMLQKMRDKVSSIQSQLPSESELPVVSSFETNNAPIMIVNVSGDYDLVTLKGFAEKIQDEIEKIKGVSDVQIIGGLEREIKIITDPQKLSVYNISLDQIRNAVAASNINFPGGNIELDNKNYNIRTVGEFENAAQLENVVITYIGSSPLFLKDIAIVEDGYSDPVSYSRLSHGLGTNEADAKSAVAISVKKKQEADVIRTSNAIHELLWELEGSLYPESLQVEISGDTARYVENELGSVIDNSKSGLFLVIIVLFLFIGFRESLVVSMVIPLAIFTAFGFMRSTDMTFNNITLFSLILAVGMLVDNGIVIMQNIHRLRSMGLSSYKAAEVATNQIAPAVASSTLTTIAAFFPIILTSGIMGAFIKAIPLTVIFALSASFFVAITITPALCAIVMKKDPNEIKKRKRPSMEKAIRIASVLLVFVLAMLAFRDDESIIFGFGKLSFFFGITFAITMAVKIFRKDKKKEEHPFAKKYGNILYDIVSNKSKRRMVLGIAIIALFLSVALVPLGILKIEMFSPTDFTRIYINVETPIGTNLDTTSAMVEEVEKRIFKFSEIKSFVSNIGITGADSFDDFAVGSGGTPNVGRIIIDLYEQNERTRTSMEVADEMRKILADIPGAKITVQELETGPPTGRPIFIKINGDNLEDLRKTAIDFTGVLQNIEGTRDAGNSIEEGSPELQIRVNKEKAALLGLDNFTVAMGIRNAVHGMKATTFRFDQTQVDVMIRTTTEKLRTVDDLNKLYFFSRLGYSVPFSQVAEIIESTSMTNISHENLKRQMNVYSDIVAGRIAGDILVSFQEAIGDYPLPAGVTIEYGGEAEDIQESFADMFQNMLIAAILVFLILAVQFNSLSQPLIILGALPMALIGVMPGLVLTGNNFGFISFVGLVALVGIVVNNAIVLLDYINYLRKSGYELKEAVKETAVTRFVPIMATTITTVGGILPITLKQPFFGPMGYTLIFGLSVATVLTLILVPVLYCMLEEFKMRRMERKMKKLQRGGESNEKTIDIIPAD